MTLRVAVAGVLAGATLLASAALAGAPVVRVGAPTGAVPPYAITGFNYGLSMQVALYAREFDAIAVETLRFPPGNDADNYPLTTDMIDALTTQWRLLGEPEPLIVANFFEGPEHAVAAARHFESVGMPVRRWEVGNEPDLYPRNRMDPSWTAEVYCERFRAFADTLKAHDPDAVIAGPAASGSRPLGLEYVRDVLRLCGDVIDLLTWHIYPTDGTWDDDAALATSDEVGREIRLVRSWLADPRTNPLGHDRDIGVAITEFGLSWRTASFRHLEDMIAALWLADALGQMAAEGIDGSHYFALQAMGGHGLIDRGGWIRPTYWVYEMLADFTGETLAVERDAGLPSAYAVRNERGVQVLFVNRSRAGAEAVLELPDDLAVTTLEVVSLDEEIFDASLTYLVSRQPAGRAVPIPARSVVLVRGAP